MRNLKFGVEIEFFGRTRDDVAVALRANGIDVKVEGYNHRVTSRWKLVTDSSVTCAGTGQYNGNEIVSPILYGDEGLDELKVVLDTLDNMNCKVDKTCGVHVHHDVNDYDIENFKSLYNLYYRMQPAINSVLPKSRRDNTYCRTLKTTTLRSINTLRSLDSLAYRAGSRYQVLNAQAYVKYGTMEFRQHSGTVSFDKVEAWVLLTFFLVNYAKHNTVEFEGSRTYSIEKLCKKFNLDGHYLENYLVGRKAKLSA